MIAFETDAGPYLGHSNLPNKEPSLEDRIAALEAKVAEPHERLEALEKERESEIRWRQKIIIAIAKQRAVNEAQLKWNIENISKQGIFIENNYNLRDFIEALREALK